MAAAGPARALPAVGRLGRDRLRGAIDVLATGMRDNPLHVQAFGADPRRRTRRLRGFLACAAAHVEDEGELLGAYVGDELVGVLGLAGPGHCRPALWRRWRCALAIATDNPPAGTWRVVRWLAAWTRHDPATPHWHLGPLAVLPAWRRRGVGSALMRQACGQLDGQGATAWLETDREVNVDFYRAFGFVVAAEEDVLGVRNWFMRRPDATAAYWAGSAAIAMPAPPEENA